MLKRPVPSNGPNSNRISITIMFVNKNTCCYSHYQVWGTHSHLHQKINKELEEAVAEATLIQYYDDPLNLAIPYVSLLDMLPEPLDRLTKSTLSLALIIFVYLYPVLIALIKYHMKIVGSYVVLSEDKQRIHQLEATPLHTARTIATHAHQSVYNRRWSTQWTLLRGYIWHLVYHR